MTNREKLMQTNLYDLLCTIQENSTGCIIEHILGIEERPCSPEYAIDKACNRCISDWLNKEEKQ